MALIVIAAGWWYLSEENRQSSFEASDSFNSALQGSAVSNLENAEDIDEFFARDSQYVYMRVFADDLRSYPTSTAHYQIVKGADPNTFRLVAAEDPVSLKGEGEKTIYAYQDKNYAYQFTNKEIMGDIVIRDIILLR